MKISLKKIPRSLQLQLMLGRDISRRLRMPAYLVGGFVRDLFLERQNFDLDIVVEGDGIKFASLYAQSLGAKLLCHGRFGTATVQAGTHAKIDIASARKEQYPAPAQLPVVEKGSMRDDLMRRDFTINAMAVSIGDADFGTLLDYYGGRDDLARKVIRVLHDQSFIDDPTRILRGVRFEQRFDFRIEPATLSLVKSALEAGMLERVQPQRIRDELVLALKEEKPLKEIRRLHELGALRFFGPQFSVSKKTLGFLRAMEKEISWFRKAHPGRRLLDSWLLYLMGLVDSLDRQQLAGLCRAMAFRKGEEKRLLFTKEVPQKLIRELSRAGRKPSRIYELLEPLSYEAIIFIKTLCRNRVFQRNVEAFLRVYNGIKISLSGDDLLGLGIVPGPVYRGILQELLSAKIDGRIKDRQDEFAYVKALMRRKWS